MTLQEKAGLAPSGTNADGEQEFIGTKEQWDKFDEMSLAKEEKEMEQEIFDDTNTSQGEIDDILSKYANR